MARSNVPKFGNWENEDNVPYTVYFDKARKNKGGKIINPNDPQENPDMFQDNDPADLAPQKPRTRPEEPMRKEAVRPMREHRTSREEEGDLRQFTNSPARGANMGQRTANESSYGAHGQRPARPTRSSAGSEQSLDRSPLHPHHQAKVTSRPGGSPAWEGRSNDNIHGTPGRSRLRPTTPQGDESPDKGAAIPRFGEWDENDPQSAENFTHIFNQVREERNTGAGNASGTPKHPSYGNRNQRSNETKKSCGCFPW